MKLFKKTIVSKHRTYVTKLLRHFLTEFTINKAMDKVPIQYSILNNFSYSLFLLRRVNFPPSYFAFLCYVCHFNSESLSKRAKKIVGIYQLLFTGRIAFLWIWLAGVIIVAIGMFTVHKN